MPDFLLKSEEIAALLLLSSSMGLGGASNTCRKKTWANFKQEESGFVCLPRHQGRKRFLQVQLGAPKFLL